MNRDDLLKLLDLNGKAVVPAGAADLAVTAAVTDPAPSAHATALDLDDWALRRGRELRAESERLQATGLDDLAVADCHGAAFLPDPVLWPDCADPRRHAFLAQLLDTPEYRSLHSGTMLNAAAAEIAAAAFAEQFAALKKEDMTGAGTTEAGATDREMATLRAVGRALATARDEVEECHAASAAFGLGPGAPGANDAAAVAALFKRVRGSPALRRIVDLAGRFRRVAQSKQRRKTTHGLDDMVGVVLDGDLGRALPVELAKLAVPEFEDDLLRRLAERQVMARDYRAIEPVGKGPVLISLDESGSMQGDKIHTAKALALAVAWVARRQRRWCGLVAYSGDSGERLLGVAAGPLGRREAGRLADRVHRPRLGLRRARARVARSVLPDWSPGGPHRRDRGDRRPGPHRSRGARCVQLLEEAGAGPRADAGGRRRRAR